MTRNNNEPSSNNKLGIGAVSKFIPKTTTKFSIRQISGLIIILILILVFVIGWLYHSNHAAKSGGSTGSGYVYKKLVGQKLTGTKPGTGMSFQLPTEFTSSPANKPGMAGFLDILNQNGQRSAIGQVSTNSTPVSLPSTASFKALSEGLNDPQSQVYKRTVIILDNWISRKISKSNPTISSSSSFTNGYIKSGAWQFDVTIRHSDPKLSPLVGKLIYAQTHQALYYFLITTRQSDWESKANQQIWQDVFNSIRFDQ